MVPYGCLGKKFFPGKGSCTFKCIKAIVQCSNSQTVVLRSHPQDAFIGSEFKTIFMMTLTLFVFLLGFFYIDGIKAYNCWHFGTNKSNDTKL